MTATVIGSTAATLSVIDLRDLYLDLERAGQTVVGPDTSWSLVKYTSLFSALRGPQGNTRMFNLFCSDHGPLW